MQDGKPKGETNKGKKAQEQNPSGIKERAKRCGRFFWLDFIRNIRRFKTWLEIAALVGVVFYACVTYRMWKDSHHNFEVDQRAWLKFGVGWPQLTDQRPAAASGTFVNVGKSVITGMYGEAAFEIVPSDKAPSFSLKQTHNTTGMKPIFPTDSDTFPIELWDQKTKQPRAFTTDEIQKLLLGQIYIATFGIVIYSDQFGIHWYRFCNWHGYSQGGNANASDCIDWNIAGDGSINVPY